MSRSFFAAGSLLIVFSLVSGKPCFLAQETHLRPDLSQLSLEELTTIEVSSVARKDHELFKTPAAVFVITHDDIRRSGISSVPELFRMVPGMQVAQISANEWAVSSRGFNGRFVDKMLVLIGGRSIYSEIYSGVYWDQNDLLVENIDRIEVIRGPGGTLWGANAVNGIINIITLKSDQTQGVLLAGEVGRLEEETAGRFGGMVGSQLHYNAYAKFLRRNQLVTANGSSADDGGSSIRAGMRADWQPTASDTVALHGDIYRGRGDERVYANLPGEVSMSKVKTAGGYALGRWERQFANYDMALQTYYSEENHGELSGSGREGAFDLDYIVHLPVYKRNEASGGAGYRTTSNHIVGNPNAFAHERHSDTLYSLFFEDDLMLVPRKLAVTGGFKLVHNSYTGFEVQPGMRGIWTPNERYAVWAAVSRAVRTPSVQELDLHYLHQVPVSGTVPTEIPAEGDPRFHSEIVHAYEAGNRQVLGSKLSLDAAGFFNEYSSLRSQSQLAPYVVTNPFTEIIIPVIYDNRLKVRSDGIEAAVSSTPTRSMKVAGGYSWMNAHKWLADRGSMGSGDPWSTPTNTVSVRSTWGFARRWCFYSSVYTVSRLSSDPQSLSPRVGAYVRADAHLSFDLNGRFFVTAGVDNLQRSRHAEFDPGDDGYSVGSQVPRSAFLKVIWSF